VGIPTSAIAIIFGLVLLPYAYLSIQPLPEGFDSDQLDPLATHSRMRGFLRFALLADTPQQTVCGQVMHKMQVESRANLVRMAEKLGGPVPK
jgi:hypothetical protein